MAHPHGAPSATSSQFEEVESNMLALPLRRTQSLSATAIRSNRLPPAVSENPAPVCLSDSVFTAYIEKSRLVLESQRTGFERERAAFATERKLWETERDMMKRRIAKLEQQVSGTLDAGTSATGSNIPGQRTRKIRSQSSPIWASSSMVPPTRVFPEDTGNFHGCPSVRRGRFDQTSRPSLDRELSPSSQRVEHTAPVRPTTIPIEWLDSTLDGIMLKSTGLPPGVVARISPPSSKRTSPPPHQTKDSDGSGQLAQQSNTYHPLVYGFGAGNEVTAITTSSSEESNISPESDVLNDETQLAPQRTLEQIKRSGSHLPQIDEDPELKGPLSLQNNENLDHHFLSVLDGKLMEAKRPRNGSESSMPSDYDGGSDVDTEIRFKKTTNFGTAFGASQCKIR